MDLETDYTFDGLGRAKTINDPMGGVTGIVYDDPNHKVTMTAPSGIQTIVRTDYAGDYIETLTEAADNTKIGLSRTYFDLGGRAIETDGYYNLSGLSYSTDSHIGTQWTIGASSGNYYASFYHYDLGGNRDIVIDGNGTITQTNFDGLGRAVRVLVGVDGGYTPLTLAASTMPNSADMALVKSYSYNNGSIDGGDGTLASVTLHPTGTVDAASDRTTSYYYDWRDRLVGTITGRQVTYQVLDNLGEATRVQSYDGNGSAADGIPPVTKLTVMDGVPVAPDYHLLRAQVDTLFDDQGRVYETRQQDVNQLTGSTTLGYLYTDMFYDGDGRVIATFKPGGLVYKTAYDAAGRPTDHYVTDGLGGDDVLQAATVDEDTVLTQSHVDFNADGQAILLTTFDRVATAVSYAYGALGLSDARVSYVGDYYDAATGRLTDTVNFGTDPSNKRAIYSSASDTPPSALTYLDEMRPYLLTHYTYDSAGNLATITDPRGIVAQNTFDALGRVVQTIQDYTNGTPTASSNVTTQYTYDSLGDKVTVTSILPAGVYRTTQYIYGAQTGYNSGTSVTYKNNDLLSAVHYSIGDAGQTGSGSSTEQTYVYDMLGEVLTFIARGDIHHNYTYDVNGRQLSDSVPFIKLNGRDAFVLEIDTAYDALGRAVEFTEWGAHDVSKAPSSSNPLERKSIITRDFDGLGNIAGETDDNSVPIPGGGWGWSTGTVQYLYSSDSGVTDNTSRLTAMIYPNGRKLNYLYDQDGTGLDESISRVDGEADTNTDGTVGVVLEADSFQGLGTLVGQTRPNLTETITLDQYGRVADEAWVNSSSRTVDRYDYRYDADGNLIRSANLSDGANGADSDIYTYDALNRVTSDLFGTMNKSWQIIGAVPTPYTYDAAGNLTSNLVTTTIYYNAENQLTTTGTTFYDNSGYLTTSRTGLKLVYDAWGRLVTATAVSDDREPQAAHFYYDAFGRQIAAYESTPNLNSDSGDSSVNRTLITFYDASGNAVQQSYGQGGHTYDQYVWSEAGGNHLVLRDRDADANIATGYWGENYSGLEERTYALQDGQGNVSTLIDSSASVVEHYHYTALGNPTVYTGGWAAVSASDSAALSGGVNNALGMSSTGTSRDWSYFWRGQSYDDVLETYHSGSGDYDPSQGRMWQPDTSTHPPAELYDPRNWIERNTDVLKSAVIGAGVGFLTAGIGFYVLGLYEVTSAAAAAGVWLASNGISGYASGVTESYLGGASFSDALTSRQAVIGTATGFGTGGIFMGAGYGLSAGIRAMFSAEVEIVEAAAAVSILRTAPELNILNPYFTPDAGAVVQNATDLWAGRLASNPSLARAVLTPAEYAAAQQSSNVARMAYGNAVERLVARDLSDPLSRTLVRYTGGPRGGNMPDFIDLTTGGLIDISTPGQIASKSGKWYGPGLVTPTYTRPIGFTLFP